MENLTPVIIVIAIVIFVVTVALSQKNRNNNQGIVKERLEQKEENQKKILEYLQGKEKVTNDDIEKMLNVSHTTAFRYLEELEKEGTIKQVGKIGQGVYYQKI